MDCTSPIYCSRSDSQPAFHRPRWTCALCVSFRSTSVGLKAKANTQPPTKSLPRLLAEVFLLYLLSLILGNKRMQNKMNIGKKNKSWLFPITASLKPAYPRRRRDRSLWNSFVYHWNVIWPLGPEQRAKRATTLALVVAHDANELSDLFDMIAVKINISTGQRAFTILFRVAL